MKKLLSFELDIKKQLLELHGNNEGLLYLRQQIDLLIQAQNSDHIHMMIPSWGGDELSEDKQCDDHEIVPNVKIFKWEK